ncbi:TetR/AcrR family transcriptional regulator [Haladaptatus cibarius]|uniref:TetR/AcrR family transcriptional regulator n=1 Tax=Haladaptatus cibarius TaxID=453847 RepID=UPI0006796B32|nr:TetR/AcrR family transcriptional regulator [Haladaptatus cibarius]
MSQRSESSDTRESIMRATYCALSKHGYADLTMQDIAEEFEKSKSLIHYHYETKEDLFVAFLDYLLDHFHEHVESIDSDDPAERLHHLLDLFESGPSDDDKRDFHVALLEIRAQAPYTDAYREQLRRNTDDLHDLAADIIRDGTETGQFDSVDPDEAATVLLATVDGIRIRRATLGGNDEIEAIDGLLSRYLGWEGAE